MGSPASSPTPLPEDVNVPAHIDASPPSAIDSPPISSAPSESGDAYVQADRPSKRDVRRAREGKKKAEEEEKERERRLAGKTKASKAAESVETEKPSTGKASRKTKGGNAEIPPGDAAPSSKQKKATSGKLKDDGRPERSPEESLRKAVNEIEEKCQKLQDRWEAEWAGGSIACVQLIA